MAVKMQAQPHISGTDGRAPMKTAVSATPMERSWLTTFRASEAVVSSEYRVASSFSFTNRLALSPLCRNPPRPRSSCSALIWAFTRSSTCRSSFAVMGLSIYSFTPN